VLRSSDAFVALPVFIGKIDKRHGAPAHMAKKTHVEGFKLENGLGIGEGIRGLLKIVGVVSKAMLVFELALTRLAL
jgi:hypothetical protein